MSNIINWLELGAAFLLIWVGLERVLGNTWLQFAQGLVLVAIGCFGIYSHTSEKSR